MLKDLLSRRRKGSLLVVLLFAVMMAIVSFGMLSVATTLYSSNAENAKRYANIQSYRSASEIACFQYVNDLEAITVTRNLTTDWVSVTGAAVYSQAIQAIQDEIGRPTNRFIWNVSDISRAITGAGISDPAVVIHLQSLLAEGRTEFQLAIDDYPTLDYLDIKTFIGRDDVYIALKPFLVNVDLTAKGEVLREKLYVDGLYLSVEKNVIAGAGGAPEVEVTMKLVEGESGVEIYRV